MKRLLCSLTAAKEAGVWRAGKQVLGLFSSDKVAKVLWQCFAAMERVEWCVDCGTVKTAACDAPKQGGVLKEAWRRGSILCGRRTFRGKDCKSVCWKVAVACRNQLGDHVP